MGSRGRHGWTKMATLRFRGSIGGIWDTNQNFMVTTILVHIVVGPGRGTWDRENKQLLNGKIVKSNIPASFGTTNQIP